MWPGCASTELRLARTNRFFSSPHPAATSINASARQHHGMLGACHYSPLQRDGEREAACGEKVI